MGEFCSLSLELVNLNRKDLENHQLVSPEALPQATVQGEVDATSEFYKSAGSTRITGFLNYLQTVTHANFLVSALNTNILIMKEFNGTEFSLTTASTVFSYDDVFSMKACDNTRPFGRAYFQMPLNETETGYHFDWHENDTFPRVRGFYGACTSVEAILLSSLDCLYDIECLHLLDSFFPALSRVCTDTLVCNFPKIKFSFRSMYHGNKWYLTL